MSSWSMELTLSELEVSGLRWWKLCERSGWKSATGRSSVCKGAIPFVGAFGVDDQDLLAWNFLLLSHRGQPFVYTIAALPTPPVVDRTRELKVACVAPTGTSAHVTCAQTVMRFVKSISAKDSYFNWGSL